MIEEVAKLMGNFSKEIVGYQILAMTKMFMLATLNSAILEKSKAICCC